MKRFTVGLCLFAFCAVFAKGQEVVDKSLSDNDCAKNQTPVTTIRVDNGKDFSTITINLKDSLVGMEMNIYKNGGVIYSDRSGVEASGTVVNYHITGVDRTAEYVVEVKTDDEKLEEDLFIKEDE